MKTSVLGFLAALGLVGLGAGCVVSVGGRSTPPPELPPSAPPPPVVTPDPGDNATIAEINAAGRLSFDAGRTEALVTIAQRPGLSPRAQVHLVNVAYTCLSFDDAKLAVLRALIAGPNFGDPARHAIVTQLNRLSFDANRQAILRDINERMKSQ